MPWCSNCNKGGEWEEDQIRVVTILRRGKAVFDNDEAVEHFCPNCYLIKTALNKLDDLDQEMKI